MKKTRRLVMLALALVLTFAMATTTTFAWFTMNDTAIVSGITGQAISDGEGLLIADDVDGPFRAYYQFPTMDLNFKAVTPRTAAIPSTTATAPVIGEATIKTIQFYNALGSSLTTEGVDTAFNTPKDLDDTAAEDFAYFQQTFYFESDVEMDIQLTKIFVEKTADGGRFVKTPDDIPANTFGTHAEDYDVNEVVPANIIDALRVAIFDADGTLRAVYQIGANGKWDTVKAASEPATIYDGYNMAGFLYKRLLNKEPIGPNPITGTTVATNNILMEGDQLVTATTLIEGDDIYTGSVTVVIWVEGTDGDCLNSVLGDAITVELTFKGNIVTPPVEEGDGD